MPQTSDQRNWLHVLLALAIALVFVFGLTPRGNAAPPTDELTWSGEQCADGLAMATLTSVGNGRWATVVVEVSIDGGQTFTALGERYNPLRFEHGTEELLSWNGDTVMFKAADAKNNGSLIGEWEYSVPIFCP